MRNGEQVRADAAQIAIQRRHLGLRGSARGGHGNSQDRVCAELGFVGRAVEFDHLVIDRGLILGFHAGDGRSNFLQDVCDSFARAFAEVTLGIGVAQLDGFMFAGGRAGGNSRAAHGSVGQNDIGFDGGIAPRVENLAAYNLDNFHIIPFWGTSRRMSNEGCKPRGVVMGVDGVAAEFENFVD